VRFEVSLKVCAEEEFDILRGNLFHTPGAEQLKERRPNSVLGQMKADGERQNGLNVAVDSR